VCFGDQLFQPAAATHQAQVAVEAGGKGGAAGVSFRHQYIERLDLQRRFDEHQAILQRRHVARQQVVAGVAIDHGQVDTPAQELLEVLPVVGHRVLGQAAVGVEILPVDVAADHADAVRTQAFQMRGIDRQQALALAEEAQLRVEQGDGGVEQFAPLGRQVGRHESVEAPLGGFFQGTLPGQEHQFGAVPVEGQGFVEDAAGEALARQVGADVGRPVEGRHAQGVGLRAGRGEEQAEQDAGPVPGARTHGCLCSERSVGRCRAFVFSLVRR